MAEYKYNDMNNEQGWGMTFDANGRFPVIGSRIFPTLDDLNAFIGQEIGTAIAGVTMGVVADPILDNNGIYEISFIDISLVGPDGKVLFWDSANNHTNLKATRISGSGNIYTAGEGINIDMNNEISATDAVVAYDSVDDSLSVTTKGKLNSSALQVIEEYIDDFDCGEY